MFIQTVQPMDNVYHAQSINVLNAKKDFLIVINNVSLKLSMICLDAKYINQIVVITVNNVSMVILILIKFVLIFHVQCF